MPNVASMAGVPIGGLFSSFWIKRCVSEPHHRYRSNNNCSTNHYKTISLVAASCMALSYFVIFFRWRNGCSPLDALFLLPFGFTLGIQYLTQYIGMAASVPMSRIGQCTGTYYIFQQLGCIVGPVLGLAAVEKLLRERLWRNLDPNAEKGSVSVQALLMYSVVHIDCLYR